jgi:UDP-MurNAc hydroxylase
VLTCQLHGWRFDLASGKCLTSVGHQIRASRGPAPADATPTTDRGVESA